MWDHRSNTLFWVDIKNPGIWRYHPEAKEHFRIDAPERMGFIALTPDQDVVIAGFKSGLPASISRAARSSPSCRPTRTSQTIASTTGMWARTARSISAPWTMRKRKAPVPSGAGTARS